MAKASIILLLSAPLLLFLLDERKNGKKQSPLPVDDSPPPPPVKPASSTWIDSLPELEHGMSVPERLAVLGQRHQMILDEVERRFANGELDLGWTDLWLSAGPLAAKIKVMNDALKIDGLRVNVDFLTSQRIADLLGIFLLTPKVADAIHAQSGIKIRPASHSEWMTDHTGSFTQRMVDHSAEVDARIERAVAQGVREPWKPGWNTELVNSPGKYWVNTKRNWEKSEYGGNYGWYDYHAPNGLLHQGPIPGLAHSIRHVDYSQIFRAMGPLVDIIDTSGTTVTLPTEQVLTDPAFSNLLSGEGPFPFARHPSIAPYKPAIV